MTPRESGLKQRIEKLLKGMLPEECSDKLRNKIATELDKTIAEIKTQSASGVCSVVDLNYVLKALDSEEGKK